MTEEEPKKKQIRFNRWALLIALLLVAGGFVLAILRDSDWWALGGCIALALVLTIFGGDEKHPGKLGAERPKSSARRKTSMNHHFNRMREAREMRDVRDATTGPVPWPWQPFRRYSLHRNAPAGGGDTILL